MTSGFVRLGLLTAAAGLALVAPRELVAQDTATSDNHLYDRFQATADFTTVLNYSNARVDGSDGRGTTLDFRSVLGISTTTVQPALGFKWRPGHRTELDVGYQFINQSGERTFTDSVIIGDNTLSGALDLKSKVGSSNATMQFKYSLWAAPRHNIGLAIGLGAIFFSGDFTGSAEACHGPDCSSGTFSISRSATAPIVSLGAFGRWRLGRRWYVGGDARGIGGQVDRYDFSVLEGDVEAQYFLSDMWGVELGWYYTDESVDIASRSGTVASGDFSGKISYNYSSLRLGAVAAF
jgi:hypothetical protein